MARISDYGYLVRLLGVLFESGKDLPALKSSSRYQLVLQETWERYKVKRAQRLQWSKQTVASNSHLVKKPVGFEKAQKDLDFDTENHGRLEKLYNAYRQDS